MGIDFLNTFYSFLNTHTYTHKDFNGKSCTCGPIILDSDLYSFCTNEHITGRLFNI
jgi:hypothetical protein